MSSRECLPPVAGHLGHALRRYDFRQPEQLRHPPRVVPLAAASYALCLETSLGRPVAACRLVFLRAAGGAEERAVDDLPAAIEEVRRLVAGGRQAGGAQAWSGPAADAAPSKLASPNANTPPSEPMSR